ncbi:MAG TPA: TonB-dependent receptor plug domain-containing protein, partial [Chitinophagaceae bacterium]
MNVRQLKLLLSFLMFGCMALAQSTNAQHYPKGNLPIKEALKRVSKSYGVQFVYDKQEVEGRYTDYDLSGVSKNTLEDVLKGVLYPNELVFLYVKSNYYTIVPKARINDEQVGNQAEPREDAGNSEAGETFVSATAKPESIVKGRVTDSLGKGVPRVTVTARGAKRTATTTTNASGNYTIDVPEGATHLVFTAVGYVEQSEPIGSRESINVSLTVDVKSLENVTVAVNTGYQVLSKERATGSYNVIGQEQLDKPAINIASRLIGTTAGMQARSLDADGNPVFEIRGLTSLNPANASPLVVVDGFPIQGDFNSINPNDVESITVLKDAAAASIWGARSANGVIVVTTRRARKGVPLRVEFSTFTRFGKKLDLDYVRPLASSAETVEYEKMAFGKWSAQINSGALTNYSKQWSAATVAMSEHELGFITVAERDAALAQLSRQDNRG